MTNPVSNLPSAQLPVPTTQIVDETGAATPLFHRFLTGLFLRTGGAAGASSSDTLAIAEAALTAAGIAQTDATLAQNTANTAATTAATAQATASSALNSASYAATVANNCVSTQLTKANNLSDVSSSSSARTNLKVAIVPVCVMYDTLSSGLVRYYPVVTPLTIPANLAGTKVYAGTVPTTNAIFTVGYIRSGVAVTIGTINVVNGGHTGIVLSTQSAVSLVAGDILTITAPSPADATLAYLSITLAPTIT